ncbi:sugar transferase, partial [Klebsiella pneumoniae]|uniref:sugar transferase n=1 Tax=Klebsiella pneumoniae TaxID=573 RepID=UPI00284508D3
KACVLPENPASYRVVRTKSYLFNKARYNEEVDYYLLSKPGMTGLWQVSGRSDVDYDTRVYLDSWYVKNWSMWNDIAILFKTIAVVLNRDGAY